jgi:hypothetical protein
MKKEMYVLGSSLSLLLMGCEGEGPDIRKEVTEPYQFVVVATSEDGTYLLQTDSVTGGRISIRENGIEGASATSWVVFEDRYLYGLAYRQGDPAEVSPYELNETGLLQERAATFQMSSRFTSYGTFDKYVVTTLAVTQSDGTPGLEFNFIDTQTQVFTQKVIPAGNFTGNGETANLSGVVGIGNRFYSGVCTTPDVNSGGTTGTVTAYPDSVWVVSFDAGLNYTLYRDARLSYASGRHRSSYRSNMATNEKGDLYVFSAAYDSRTTCPSGALRILSGATEFDPDYYFNIEALSGGINLFTAWHITGDYFLLHMDISETEKATSSTGRLAVIDANKKTFQWVKGLPEDMESFGSTPCTDEGKIAIPVTAASAYPAIYIIDPVTVQAVKGLEVEADGVVAVAKLTY